MSAKSVEKASLEVQLSSCGGLARSAQSRVFSTAYRTAARSRVYSSTQLYDETVLSRVRVANRHVIDAFITRV